MLQTEIREVQRAGAASADGDHWVQNRHDAGQSGVAIERAVLGGCFQEGKQVGDKPHPGVVMQHKFAVQTFGRLLPAFQRHVSGCHEKQIYFLLSCRNLGADAVDVFEKGYVGLEKGWLGGGIDKSHGGDGSIGGGLAAADEVDFWGGGLTGEGEGG